MRYLSWLFSLFLHLTVVLGGILLANMEMRRIKLDVPVYEVELVDLRLPGPGVKPDAAPGWEGPGQPGQSNQPQPPGPSDAKQIMEAKAADDAKKAAEKAAADAHQKALAEEAARKAAADKAAAEKAARDAAEKAAKDKALAEEAARIAAEKAAREKAEKEAADKAAKEKAAKDAADKAAKEKAEKEKAEKEAAEKAAKEKAAKDAADKAAKEKAAKDAADKAAKERQDVLAQALKDAKSQAGSSGPGDPVARELANLRKQAGQAGGGGGGGGSPEASATYGAIVNKLIKQNWRFPQFANLKLVCVVELHIGTDGRIQSSRLTQPSGRPDFDNSALRAVQDTGDLPKPPSGVERIELTFNSQERR